MRCFALFLIAATIGGLAGSSVVRGDSVDGPDLAKAQQSIIDQTNALRKENGLDPVKSSDKLNATAAYFAKFMADSGQYGHRADGHDPSERATKHGYDYALINENIAWQSNSDGFSTEELADGFGKGWENSPAHRKNMLDPDVTDIGVAIAKASDGKYYAVQMFGRPKSAATTFTITNRSSRTIRYSIEDKTYELQPSYSRKHTAGRPPDVRVTFPGETAPIEFKPIDNVEYVIRPTSGGKLEVSHPATRPTTRESHATAQHSPVS